MGGGEAKLRGRSRRPGGSGTPGHGRVAVYGLEWDAPYQGSVVSWSTLAPHRWGFSFSHIASSENCVREFFGESRFEHRWRRWCSRESAHASASPRLGNHVMKTYRCCFRNQNSRVRAFRHIGCADDPAATTVATNLLKQNLYSGVELLHRERRIAQGQNGSEPKRANERQKTPFKARRAVRFETPALSERAASDNT